MTTPIPVQSPPVSALSDEELLSQDDNINNPQELLEKAKEEAEGLVINIVSQIDRQERPTREILIKIWKYLDLLWTGIANFYWNSTTNQWKPITYDDVRHLSENSDIDPTLLNKTINMLRPYGESIIGALTVTNPRNKYFPADADSIDDINTARAYINIEQKIALDNEIKTKMVQMIMNLLVGGFFGVYNYSHASEDFGTVSQPTYENKKFRIDTFTCSECGAEISQDKTEDTNDTAKNAEVGMEETINEPLEENDDQPNLDQVIKEQIENITGEEQDQQESMLCPSCGLNAPPMMNSEMTDEQVKTGDVVIPKCRQILEVYGPLQVKIPTHASKKEEVLWCILEDEIHESHARYLYPDYRDKIQPGSKDDLAYDRWARSQYENMGELNQYYVTRRRVWLRPSAYEFLGDEETPEKLKALFPEGLMAVFMNQNLLYIESSEMDDHWTFSLNPIYRRLYGDPLLKAGIPLQETTNDLFQLELETVKYAIPQTFADPAYFDFEAYRQSKSQPGLIYPMKMPSGQPLQNALANSITANLPKEVEVLEEKLEKLFQFILGVFPSVFGGEQSSGKTLGEYEQSRAQALQRLNINPQEVVHRAYAQAMAKAIRQYAEDLLEDEAYVQSKGNTFVNVWIRKSELTGKIGEVIPEFSEQFPVTWGQKKAAWMELMGLNNQAIIQILFHPENIHFLSDMLSMDELYIPGDDQRNKQLDEIKNLITIQPQIDPMTNQPIEQLLQQSTVPIEPIDDNNIHYQVISAFICSQIGQALKETNPLAYQNLMLHAQEHMQVIQQQMMAQQQEQQTSQDQGNKGSEKSQEQVGEANV